MSLASRRRLARRGSFVPAAALLLLSAAGGAQAVEIDVGKVSCQRYQDEILHPPPGSTTLAADPIDTTMWLLGYSIGRSGEHVMYSDALTSFGFALDAECRNNPSEFLQRAVGTVKSKRDHPMDLQRLTCSAWAERHTDLKHTDVESANTLMMWMYGFAVANSDGQVLKSNALPEFSGALEGYCGANPSSSMFDALLHVRVPGAPASKPPVTKPPDPGSH